jgi:YidC/Oxa1 family membrane protein insertase
MQWISNTFLYEFFYNVLIGLTNLFPGASIGVAVIILTIIVKLLLAPLTYRSIKNQVIQKKLQPKLAEIKKNVTDTKEQSQQIMALYREHKTNPFAGCLLILIQIPIIFALYAVFLQGLEIIPDRLYSFISAPAELHTMFLGLDLTGKSIILAVLAGLSQFTQMQLSPALRSAKKDKRESTEELSTQQQFTESMQKSMKYSMPVMIGIFAYIVPAAVALYWVVSNIFTIVQELVIRKKIDKPLEEEPAN